MANITIAIAEGDATPFLNPDFHSPEIITVFNKIHTIYTRKWRVPEGVNEVFSRDIDVQGINRIPIAYCRQFADYIRKTVKPLF